MDNETKEQIEKLKELKQKAKEGRDNADELLKEMIGLTGMSFEESVFYISKIMNDAGVQADGEDKLKEVMDYTLNSLKEYDGQITTFTVAVAMFNLGLNMINQAGGGILDTLSKLTEEAEEDKQES